MYVYIYIHIHTHTYGCPLCRPGWPHTQKSACLCLPRAGIKGMCHHTRQQGLNISFAFLAVWLGRSHFTWLYNLYLETTHKGALHWVEFFPVRIEWIHTHEVCSGVKALCASYYPSHLLLASSFGCCFKLYLKGQGQKTRFYPMPGL